MIKKITILLILVLLGFGYYIYKSLVPTSKSVDRVGASITTQETQANVEVLLTSLDIPWETAFLPDKTLFITERKGIVWQLDGEIQPDGRRLKKQILELAEVAHVGEGGLLGMAHHPNHAKNGYTYLYYTYENNGLKNKVVRYLHIGDSLKFDREIIDDIPGNSNHNGGRIAFGPDNKLYITTGDSQNPSTSQDLSSLAGKILRVSDDGTVPTDNPFPNSPVYSYGHRNPQGLAWDKEGSLWATEHGQSAQDEVNQILPGKNYGWPIIRGDDEKEGMEKPFFHSGSSTWAPSGMVINGNLLYFAGLRGGAIFALNLKTKELKQYFKNEFGRIRTIVMGEDENFYILTNNRDGRGVPVAEDDRLIRIPPNLLR